MKVIAGALVAAVLGFLLLRRYALSESPGMDAWITVFSVLATWMMAKKASFSPNALHRARCGWAMN